VAIFSSLWLATEPAGEVGGLIIVFQVSAFLPGTTLFLLLDLPPPGGGAWNCSSRGGGAGGWSSGGCGGGARGTSAGGRGGAGGRGDAGGRGG